MPEGLLEEIKKYLDITWTDTNTDLKLTCISIRGMKYIDNVAGEALNYSVEDKPKELLLEYCRYVRSNALEEFQNNYLHELLTLQINREVARYEAETTVTNV